MVIGYKGTDTNMTCKTFRYTLNQEYTMDKDTIIMCAIGFHFSPKLEDVLDYYFDKDSRFFEVEADECLDYSESDKKIVCAKIKLTREIFPYDVTFPNHRALMLKLCTTTPYSLKWIPSETKTPDFLLEVLKVRPEAIEYISNPTTEMMLEAVKAYGPTILFLPKASDDIKMTAIKNHWYSIRHISSPSEALQFEAVYNDIDAIYFIDKPSQAVKDYVDGVKDGSIIPIPPGGVNYNGIYLNEICGADENSVDWVELYNTSNDVKDLSDVKIVKDGAIDTAFVFPKNTAIQPKEVLAVSNADDGLFNISNSKAVKIELCKPNNEVLDTFNTTSILDFAGHPVGGSYARIPDGTGAWEVQTTHSIGERNAAIVVSPSEMIRLNEICGAREHSDDDWVELYNMSNVEVDISNFQLKKDGEDSIFTIPNGTKIAPKGLKVFGNINDGMFKISNSKSVTVGLETNDGVLIDFFDKDANLPIGSAHVVGGSYAREVDGTGDWVVKTTNTIGEYNSGGPIIENPYEGLVLNEICGYGADGDKDDWVELYNNSERAIELQGLKLLYSNGTPEIVDSEIYAFTQSTIIQPKGLHVISLKGIDGRISNVKIITVKLVTQSNGNIDTFNRSLHSVGEGHEPGGSYARIPNGTGVWTSVNVASKGVINPESYTPPQVEPSDPLLYEGLVLNEVCGYGEDKEDDWVELYNNSEKDINISGIILKKDFTQIYKVASGTTMTPNQYLVLGIRNGDFSNGISNSKAVRISLHMPDGTEIENQVFNKVSEVDDVLYGNGHPNGGSYARIPNGTGNFTVVNVRTEGTINTN